MNNGSGRIGPGASTILMILVVLVMTMLGVLALASARNDLEMSQRTEQSAQDYYNSQTELGLLIKELDETLISLRAQAGGSEAEFARLTAESLGVAPGGETQYTLPVGETRLLCATVQILPLTKTDRFLIIETHIEPNQQLEFEEDATWTLIA